jgi:hypothetical protein
MSNLKSQQVPTAEEIKTLVPILLGAGNIAHFAKQLATHLKTNFGEIGHSIINKTKLVLEDPGPKPTETDLRLHPLTKQPILNDRKYLPATPTREQLDAHDFDRTSLRLSADGKRSFDSDKSEWYKDKDAFDKRLLHLKTLDDACLNFILTHVSSDAKEVINSHTNMAAFDSLPVTSIHRSSSYLEIISIQFATGNATSTVDEMIKFFSQHQGDAEINTPAAHFNNLNDQWWRIEPILDQCADTTEIKQMLRTMVAIQSLDQNHRPTLRALEIYLQRHPGFAAMQNFADLQAEVLAGATSDLNRIKKGTSEQSSAFAAKLSPTPPLATPNTPRDPTYGLTPRPGKGPHCPNCHSRFKRFYYHPLSECRTLLRTTTTLPTTPPPRTKAPSNAQLAARIAAMESQPLDHHQQTPQDLTPQQLNAMLARYTVNGGQVSVDDA